MGSSTSDWERKRQACQALANGDVQAAEKLSGRKHVGTVGPASWRNTTQTLSRPTTPTVSRSTPAIRIPVARSRERRERPRSRASSASGRDGPSDLDPPSGPRARGPRHISHALAGAGFDPFERPLDRLLAGLRAHSPDAYRLVPGERGDPDHWIARCPLHVDAGFTLVVTEGGGLSCRLGCPEWAVRCALLEWVDPERKRAAAAVARAIVWGQTYGKRRKRRRAA